MGANKKKILIINQHFSTGGIKKSLDNLLPVLMERYDVKVAFVSGGTEEFDNKYPGVRINSPFLLSSALSSLKELKRMNLPLLRIAIKVLFFLASKFISTERLVHLAVNLCAHLGEYDCVISYAHDNWSPNGAFYGGSNYLAIKKTTSNNKISWVHGEPETIGLTKERLMRSYQDFDHVVSVSNAVKGQFELLSEGKIKSERIYNLLDIDDVLAKSRNAVYTEDNDIFRIVTVGRLSKVAKRIDKVNEIAKKLRDNGYAFHWTVVGGGSEYENCLAKRAEYGLEAVVDYVGNQSNPYPYMKESDLLVVVSDTEAMSLVLREALVVGTPVISTDFPAVFETVQDGKNGFVVQKDVESIYSKIAFCIEHRNTLKSVRSYIKAHPITNDNTIRDIVNLTDG